MRVLGLIPARGGSKGIPRKNIACLCGEPLIAYTARAALAAELIECVVASTEDEEIADVARTLGLRVPFLRPMELALDETPTVPVVLHTLRSLEERGERYDAVCLLQCTVPFRQPGEIDMCIRLLEQSNADAVATVSRVPHQYHPGWVYRRDNEGLLSLFSGQVEPPPRRQDLPPAFCRDGSVYVTRCEVVMQQNSLYGRRLAGCVVDAERVNLDTAEDWRRAEALQNRFSFKPGHGPAQHE